MPLRKNSTSKKESIRSFLTISLASITWSVWQLAICVIIYVRPRPTYQAYLNSISNTVQVNITVYLQQEEREAYLVFVGPFSRLHAKPPHNIFVISITRSELQYNFHNGYKYTITVRAECEGGPRPANKNQTDCPMKGRDRMIDAYKYIHLWSYAFSSVQY